MTGMTYSIIMIYLNRSDHDRQVSENDLLVQSPPYKTDSIFIVQYNYYLLYLIVYLLGIQ